MTSEPVRGISLDWRFRVPDIIKLIVLLIAVGVAYERLDSRVENVEKQARANSESLQRHIEHEETIISQGLKVLDQLTAVLQQFPPHRHTKKGEIIYPNHPDGDGSFP